MEDSVDKQNDDEEEKNDVMSPKKSLFQSKKLSSFYKPLCMERQPTEESIASFFPQEEGKESRKISRVLNTIHPFYCTSNRGLP